MPRLVGARARQLSLSFGEAPVWDGTGLEAALLRETARPLRLTLTQNRSVLLSFRRKSGVIHLRDVVYYVVISYVFLFMATRVLEARRWR